MKFRIVAAAVTAIALASPASGSSSDTSPKIVGAHGDRSVARFERFEASAQIHGDYANPFDPDRIDVRGHFRGPSGHAVSTIGFYYEGFTRELIDGREVVTSTGESAWKVRFSPDAVGRWSWWLTARTPSGSTTTEPRTFTVAPSDEPGHVRRSTRDHRYLVHDDGSPYFAIGENVAFPDKRGTFAYDSWYERLAEQDATYARVWTPPYGFGIEWSDTPLGDYRGRLDRAWQLDHAFEEAERRGIRQVLSFWSQGAFNPQQANGQWATNPYNAANGGPLETPSEVFTDPEAKELFKQRFRYTVARWGYSTHLLAWELWNEVDLIPGYDSASSAAWHKEMADYIRSLDPQRHLITTSFSDPTKDPLVWMKTGMDYTQFHHYPVGEVRDRFTDFAVDMASWDTLATTGYQRPVLFAEFGIGPWPQPRDVDPDGIAFHDGLWAGALSGAFGTGMTWWWDLYIDGRPDHFYPMFGAVSRFVDGVQWDREGFLRSTAAPFSPTRTLVPVGLQGPRRLLLWVKDDGHQWNHPDPMTVADARVVVGGLALATWCGGWWDTGSGRRVADVRVTGGEPSVLDVPDFVGDTALRLDRC